MSIRKIFSARAAQPKVEAALQAIVKAAVFLGCADGSLEEVEVDSLVDGVREVARKAVGDALAAKLVPVPRLLDWARQALHDFASRGEAAFLEDTARALQGDFKRDALMVAFRVLAADHTIEPREEAAFRRLVAALGYEAQEKDALAQMAKASVAAMPHGPDAEGIELVKGLQHRGWKDPFVELRAAGVEVHWFDASLQYVPSSAPAKTLLRVDLDAHERALHLHVTDERDVGPHLILYYGKALPQLLQYLDSVKDSLSLASVEEHLRKLHALCPDLFLESEGRLVKLGPPP